MYPKNSLNIELREEPPFPRWNRFCFAKCSMFSSSRSKSAPRAGIYLQRVEFRIVTWLQHGSLHSDNWNACSRLLVHCQGTFSVLSFVESTTTTKFTMELNDFHPSFDSIIRNSREEKTHRRLKYRITISTSDEIVIWIFSWSFKAPFSLKHHHRTGI